MLKVMPTRARHLLADDHKGSGGDASAVDARACNATPIIAQVRTLFRAGVAR